MYPWTLAVGGDGGDLGAAIIVAVAVAAMQEPSCKAGRHPRVQGRRRRRRISTSEEPRPDPKL